jgi:hypothetical protein
MALSIALMNYLKKGSFPPFSTDGIVAWSELIKALADDAEATWDEITAAIEKNMGDASKLFPDSASVNKVSVKIVGDDLSAFLGAAHARMCGDFSVANNSAVQPLLQQLRAVMQDTFEESEVKLWLNPNHLMGNRLVAAPLTCIPDQAHGVSFGSVPDQKAIAQAAPVWSILKRRAYENKGVLTRYGAKPHYVLAHFLNHNLNGSGSDARNVVPLWASANTDMAKRVEKFVKELVQRGATGRYNITCGGAVGMTTARKALQSQCDAAQWELIQAEATLPENLVIEFDVLDQQNNKWVNVLKETITNYVPETVPYMRKA